MRKVFGGKPNNHTDATANVDKNEPKLLCHIPFLGEMLTHGYPISYLGLSRGPGAAASTVDNLPEARQCKGNTLLLFCHL